MSPRFYEGLVRELTVVSVRAAVSLSQLRLQEQLRVLLPSGPSRQQSSGQVDRAAPLPERRRYGAGQLLSRVSVPDGRESARSRTVERGGLPKDEPQRRC